MIAILAAVVTTGYAQNQFKVGVVNSQEVLEKSIEGKRIMAQIEERNKKIQADLARLDETIRGLQTRLNTQQLTLTNEALANLTSDIDRRQTERKRLAEDGTREIQELTGRLFQRVQTELMPIIEQIGKDKGLEIIFDLYRSGAIYYSPVIELTNEVIQKYDASKSGQ